MNCSTLAIAGKLKEPAVLERQVRRMLADARSRALVSNFAEQWLHLRNLDSITPDMRLFPDFDDNLRQAFRQETELFFESILREDRSVLDLLSANYTFVNERLAKHYGIPHVYGSRFRRITLGEDSGRGGLLRQGSILTVTSYATRTSPVIRGKWILDNLLGVPPPPPLPDVPALKDNTVDGNLSVRERLAEHRANPACAGCHNLMDPVGFSLEKFDAVGRWRTVEGGHAHRRFRRPSGRQQVRRCRTDSKQALLSRPELFVGTFAEKLLTYASRTGSRVLRCAGDPQDRTGGAVARISAFSSLILGIVQQPAVSDEEITMIITKKALPRRTFLRGMGATLALPLLDAMVPSMTALAKTPANPVRRLGFVYMPMGCDIARWTPPGEGRLVELSPTLQSLAPVRGSAHGHHQPGAEERLSGHPCDLQRRLPERGQGEVDRKHGLLPGHDGRSNRREADRPGDAAAVAGAGDGSAPDGRSVRQRLCVRLPEQSLLVVADDAASGRGPPAHRLRAPVRRGRQRGRPPRGAAEKGQPSRLGERRYRSPSEEARPGRSHQGQPVSRYRPRGGAPHSEGRGRDGGQPAAGSRSPGRRAGCLRRPRAVDVRPAGAGSPG